MKTIVYKKAVHPNTYIFVDRDIAFIFCRIADNYDMVQFYLLENKWKCIQRTHRTAEYQIKSCITDPDNTEYTKCILFVLSYDNTYVYMYKSS